MSKSEDKRFKRRVEHAEFLWERAQMKAAAAQSVLEFMIAQYEQHKEELSEEVVTQTEEQIALRKKELEDYLMGEKAQYEERLGVIQ